MSEKPNQLKNEQEKHLMLYEEHIYQPDQPLQCTVELLEGGILPTRKHAGDLGWDLYMPDLNNPYWQNNEFFIDGSVGPYGRKMAEWRVRPIRYLKVWHGATIKIPLRLKLELAPGYGAELRTRSSMALKGFIVGGGIIDGDYRGELAVILHYIGYSPRNLYTGDRIAQLLIRKNEPVTLVEGTVSADTARGEGGFGSTGR